MEKPLNAFDVNFELLHSGVASLPGKSNYVYFISIIIVDSEMIL